MVEEPPRRNRLYQRELMFLSDSRVSFSIAAAVFMTAAAFAQPAHADRLSLSERVTRLEQQASGGQGSVELVNQIQALQSQIQALQGQVEELRHQLGQAQQRAKDQYIDLDSRIGRIEGTRGGAVAPSTATDPNQDAGLQDIQLGNPATTDSSATSLTPEDESLAPVDPSTSSGSADSAMTALDDQAVPVDPEAEKRSYDEAFAALKDGRYSESARRFQAFIDQYPNADLTGNAYYWLGESYYVTQNYRVALDTFSTLLTRFPQNQKAPDALLKTGYCQYELKQWDAAERTLNNVITVYPNTTVARLAQGRLRALQLENRR
ncbi:MAG TPA: tol-pal system protein YbgF [Dokdonella sp.]|uniref:tol-pal system protein YbgF n=1 Tax=Dokdonella sp. TaxID=2291710 RepID=UPI002D7FC406|nr:tol-pal system protein YbgF [Dokdonella sp.]HET9032716.1 tol-pal system protein YbgF [Dokdonella sp.]